MSRLYYSEEGRVTPALCEEVTRFRRVRKHLELPETGQAAQLFLLARAYPDCDTPLKLAINSVGTADITPLHSGFH